MPNSQFSDHPPRHKHAHLKVPASESKYNIFPNAQQTPPLAWLPSLHCSVKMLRTLGVQRKSGSTQSMPDRGQRKIRHVIERTRMCITCTYPSRTAKHVSCPRAGTLKTVLYSVSHLQLQFELHSQSKNAAEAVKVMSVSSLRSVSYG